MFFQQSYSLSFSQDSTRQELPKARDNRFYSKNFSEKSERHRNRPKSAKTVQQLSSAVPIYHESKWRPRASIVTRRPIKRELYEARFKPGQIRGRFKRAILSARAARIKLAV